MRRRSFLMLSLVVLFAMAIRSNAWSQHTIGPFEITGLYQYTINPSTGPRNPNNFTCLTGPCSPGLQRKAGAPDFLLMRQLLDLNIYGKLSENLSVTFQPRFFHDMTKSVDSHFRQYDSFPRNFSGQANLLEAGGNDFNAELRQVYLDYTQGDLWLRIGKQQIAWGEALGLRVLDTINPLDLRQFVFFDRIFEEFDRIRIPQWFIRANYTIPTDAIPDLTAEFLLNPGAVVPTLLPAQGSPYNLVPAFLKIRENVNQGEPTVGGRLTGTVGDFQFSLNALTKPNDDAVGVFKAANLGCFAPPFDPVDCEIILDGRHPRIYTVGGSINYNWAWAGAILRAETTVTPNAPFLRTIAATPTRIVERPVWKTVLAVDRPTYVIPGLDSMTIGVQFFETFTGGSRSLLTDTFGSPVDQAVHVFTFFFQQPLFAKRVSLELFGLFDTDDAHWIQPGVRWEIGNHMRLDAYYNEFGGAEKRAGRFGSFYWADGAFLRFTYGF